MLALEQSRETYDKKELSDVGWHIRYRQVDILDRQNMPVDFLDKYTTIPNSLVIHTARPSKIHMNNSHLVRHAIVTLARVEILAVF